MAGIFSGLKQMGLGDLEDSDLYAEEKTAEQVKASAPKQMLPEEKELIYDKSFTCPVCDQKFTSRIVKSGKARALPMDLDLRPRHEGIDTIKYDVLMCPDCGYAAISRYFDSMTSSQIRLIREKISGKVMMKKYTEDYYTYEEAVGRYKMALVCAMVKKAKNSEKAYVCLKSAWLMRGYREDLERRGQLTNEKREELISQETEYLQNAYKGFVDAQQSESYPICGMDEHTMDYLTAALAYEVDELDMASRCVARLLVSTANARIKDKARTLKDMIMAKRKETGK